MNSNERQAVRAKLFRVQIVGQTGIYHAILRLETADGKGPAGSP